MRSECLRLLILSLHTSDIESPYRKMERKILPERIFTE